MENDSAASFFNKFTNFFTIKEKNEPLILAEDTPVLSFFRSLSEKSVAFGNSSFQKPQTDGCYSESAVESDTKDDKAMEIPSQSVNTSSTEMPSEKEVSLEAEDGLKITGKLREQCNTHPSLEQRRDNNVKTELSISMDQKETREPRCHKERELLDMDQQVNVHQGNSSKGLSSACQSDQEAADGQADMLSRALSLESVSGSLRNPVTVKSHSAGGLSDTSHVHMTKQIPLVKGIENAENITYGNEEHAQDESKHQEKTNKLKYTHSETPDMTLSQNMERHVSFANIDNLASAEEGTSISSTNNKNEFYTETDDQEVSTGGNYLVLSNRNLEADIRFPTTEMSTELTNPSFTGMSGQVIITVPKTTFPAYSRTVANTLVDDITEHSDVSPTLVCPTNAGATSVQIIVKLSSEESYNSVGPETSNVGSIESMFTPMDTSSNLAEVSEAANSLNHHIKEEGYHSSELDTLPKCKPDQILLKLDPAAPNSENKTQEERELKKDGDEAGKLEIANRQRKEMEDHKESATNGMVKEEQGATHLDISSSPSSSQDQPISGQAISSPGPVLKKPRQLPFFFTRLKEFEERKKNDSDEQQMVAAAPEQNKGPDLMKRRSVKRGLFSDQSSKKEVKGSFLEQLSQLLSFDASKFEVKREPKTAASPPLSPISQDPATENLAIEETAEESNVASSEGDNKSPNAETALDAFKAFFTPKPPKRDLEAVKRTLNKEAIRAFFDKSSSKSPDNRNVSDSKFSESEERTPGRLQAIWPPPKPKDKEEKIGLKYTEAEHQAALLQLKRECKEEVESLEADFKLQLFRLREENAESVSRLQSAIAELREKAKRSHRDLQDASVSTEDNVTPRAFRTVCIQTDRETFIKPVEGGELSSSLRLQPNVPKKLNLTSINLSLSGKPPVAKQDPPPLLPTPPPPPPPPLPVQSDIDSSRTLPLLPDLCVNDVMSNPTQSLGGRLQLEKSNAPPPPPAPPLMAGCGLPPPPPPPPPIPGSAPPPPTGAHLLFSRAEEWPQRKPRVEPVCPMKPLYWTRIQIQNNRNDTLWTTLKEPDIINTNEFAELFAKMSSPAKRKPLSEAYEKTVKSKKIIKLLDSKRSQAVGILISSLHLDMKDIQQAVLMLDNSVVDLDAIEALYENRSQPEELERIRKHYETSDEEQVKLLDKPEQFLYELSQIPEFSLRARSIILQSTFTDAIASIKHKTEIVIQVCKDLLEWARVKEVLGLVLALGNYMNGGSRTRGQADGFGLDILPKLKDVKSKDNRISLLDYMVSYYVHNLDENAGTENCVFPLPEPQDVFLAAQVKFEDLSKELRKLGNDLSVCEKDVLTVSSRTSPNYIHPFKEKMETFIASAQNEKTATEHRLISAQKSFRDLVEYFGMRPRSGEQDVLPGNVFMLWFEFCNDFKTRWKRENKAVSKERLKEAQQSVRNITAEKKVETRKVHAHGLKERLRLKEASIAST